MRTTMKLVLALLVLPGFFFACGEDVQDALNDTTPPVVTITDPSNGDTFAETFVVTAAASDPESKIVRVEFFFDGKPSGAGNFPLEASVQAQSSAIKMGSLTNGTYRIDAVAKNGVGLVSTNSINVIIAKDDPAQIPVVAITGPVEGSVQTGDFTITATATVGGAATIARVEFFLGTNLTPFATDTTAPYSTLVDTSALDNGVYAIKARAVSSQDLASSVVSFIVFTKYLGGDVTPPVISSVSPASGAVVSADFIIGAAVSDPESGVANVKFFFNDSAEGVDTTAPFQSTLVSIALLDNGPYPVRIEAYNGEGLATTNSYTITIQKSVVVQNAYVTNVVTIANDYSAFDAPSATVTSAIPTLHWTSGGIGGIQSYKIEVWDADEENVIWAVANIGSATLQLPWGTVPGGAEQLAPASGAPGNLVNGLYIVNVVGINNASWEIGEPVAIAHLRMTVNLSAGAARSAEPLRMMPRAEYEQMLRDRRGW